jgi:rhodanese-related sulfurtransferase
MGYWKRSIVEAVWVSILALVLACSAYALRSHALPVIPPAADAAGTDSTEGDIASISLEEAQRHFEQGTAIFVDARPMPAFAAGHIRGALHLDPQEFDEWSSRVFSEVPADALIISYCDGAQCTLSHELAEKLIWLGYQKVMVIKDGWGRWQSRQLPVDRLADPST